MMIAIPVAVRPNFAKIWPVTRELEKKGMNYFIVHTGQHYSKSMSDIFLDEFNIKPVYNLSIGSGNRKTQIRKARNGLNKVFDKEKPSLVYVRGDTNMVPAAIDAAKQLHIKTIHEEAGLRSIGIAGKEQIKCIGIEEQNRIIAERNADCLIAHTQRQMKNLISEGINKEIHVTGSPVVDTIRLMMSKAKKTENKIPTKDDYIIIQLHKPYTTEYPIVMKSVFKALQTIQQRYDISIMLGHHPRAENSIKRFGLKKLTNSFLREGKHFPHLDYTHFLKVQMDAQLVVTDSATLQEETCTLKVPCVSVTDATDRPETLDVGSNYLAGQSEKSIRNAIEIMINRKRSWKNPFGNGKAGKRIVRILEKNQ